MYMYFVFFKQKTAYEMRISDWSSDVCSSDLGVWPDEVNWQEGRSDPTLTRQICNGWKANRAIANVVLREDFCRAIAQMGGWHGTRIMVDDVLSMTPETRQLGHHQDSASRAWYTPSDLLRLWISLEYPPAVCRRLDFRSGS